MLAFLPALARTVLGTDLVVPNIATWWLGRTDIREQLSAKLDSMVIAAAFTDFAPNMQLGSEYSAPSSTTRNVET